MSTVSPDTSRMLAEAVSGRFVDAPILGVPAAVLERQAILLLGGDAAMLERLAPLFEDLAARQIHGDHGGWFTMRLGRKDLGLAHALGSRAGLQLELTETVERLFDRAIDAGFADRDIAAVVEAVRARRAPVPT
jgi:3-hydroxyisobutyrate dehydrogenase-like beta-hydroxyacid dehydrogenase